MAQIHARPGVGYSILFIFYNSNFFKKNINYLELLLIIANTVSSNSFSDMLCVFETLQF